MKRARYFLAGVWEHRWTVHSGAAEYKLMDAYWRGVHFARALPRPVRRRFPKAARK